MVRLSPSASLTKPIQFNLGIRSPSIEPILGQKYHHHVSLKSIQGVDDISFRHGSSILANQHDELQQQLDQINEINFRLKTGNSDDKLVDKNQSDAEQTLEVKDNALIK